MSKPVIQLPSNIDLYEWFGSILAIIGAILIALNIHLEILAFVIYIVSNILLIKFSTKKKHYGILIMSLTFVIINMIGIIRWL